MGSVALLVLSVLGAVEDELRVKQLLAIPLIVAYGLWAINNENLFLQSQTHYEWEVDEKHVSPYPEPSMVEKPFMGPNGLKMNGSAARFWGLFGACGVTTARNILYVCDPEKFNIVIFVLGLLEVSLLGMCLMCMLRFYWKAGIIHELALFKPARGFDLTKPHLLPFAMTPEGKSCTGNAYTCKQTSASVAVRVDEI